MRPRISHVHGLCTFNDKSADTTEDAKSDDLVIPEDFSALDDEALDQFHNDARETFRALYNGGEGVTQESYEQLEALRSGIVGARAELGSRREAREALASKAAEFAADVDSDDNADDVADNADADNAENTEAPAEEPATTEAPAEDAAPIVEDKPAEAPQEPAPASASVTPTATPAPRVTRVRRPSPAMSQTLPPEDKPVSPLAAMDTGATRFSTGAPITLSDAAEILASRYARFNEGAYASARAQGRSLRETFQLATLSRKTDPSLVIADETSRADGVLAHAADETRLPGGSLVASGGWCAPSTIDHTIPGAVSTAEGVFRLPEVQAPRGGLTRTLGPKFSDMYAVSGGFRYTEQEDIDGNYDGNGGGSKPCVEIDCPDFEEFRLGLKGYCVSAGLLKKRAYPEYIARFLQEFLTGYEHHLAKERLMHLRTKSEAITMPADKGAAAPLLRSLELQALHMRALHRMSDSATIEVVLPKWVRAVLRDDLARRNGVDMLSVNDAQIDAWFRERKVAPQYVVNWQDIAVYGKSALTGWPNRVEFLMYPAGTWVEAVTDVINIQDQFDTTQLKQNHYTALFAESGSVIVPMGHDSRVVTVPLEATGSTGSAVAHPANSVDSAVMYSASLGTTTTSTTTTTTTS